MSYPSTLDNLPDVVTGQLITASYISSSANAINAIEVALSTNPFGPYASVAAAIAGKLDINYGVDSQPSDNYVITLSPAPSSYTAGLLIRFKANTTNTGASTINVNSLGAITIKKLQGNDLAAGDILAGQIVELIYDGTNFQMLSSPSGPMTALGDLTYGNTSGVPARLPGNNATSKKFLTQTGTGSASAAPGWNGIVPGDLPSLDQVPTPVASVSMNNQRITNLADPVSLTDAATAKIIQKGTMNYAVDGGTANSYTATLSPAPAAYTAGMIVDFKAANANTGASTLNVNSLGAVTIKKRQGQDLDGGDILAGQMVSVAYDGINFQLLSAPSTLDNPMSAVGDMLYGGTGGAESRLAGNTSTSKRFLTQTGTGSASAAPAWNGIAPGDLPTLDQMPAPTASLSLNNQRIINLADPVSLTDAATAESVQKAATIYAADSGSPNTYVVTLSPAPAAYVTGMIVVFKAANTNNGASTLNVNGLGAVALVNSPYGSLTPSAINAGQMVVALYDGTHFQVQSPWLNFDAFIHLSQFFN